MLNKRAITEEIKKGNISVSNLVDNNILENGIVLSLNKKLKVSNTKFKNISDTDSFEEIIIPEEGYILDPAKFYLGATNEFTKTHNLVPLLSNPTVVSATGLQTHVTAGFGDNGFEGTWTLEISCLEPTKVYPNSKVCYILYHPLKGDPSIKYEGKYQKQEDATVARFNLEDKKDVLKKKKDELNILLNNKEEIKNDVVDDKNTNSNGGMLTSLEIKKQITNGNITIKNIKDDALNKPNSCDVYMDNTIYCFADNYAYTDINKATTYYNEVMRDEVKYLRRIAINKGGILLKPNVTYFARTREQISTCGYVPVLNGKLRNSLLGLSVELNSNYYQSDYNGVLFLI